MTLQSFVLRVKCVLYFASVKTKPCLCAGSFTAPAHTVPVDAASEAVSRCGVYVKRVIMVRMCSDVPDGT